MIIVLRPEATKAVAQELLNQISERGLQPLHMPGAERVVLGALGDERVLAELNLESHPMVELVKPILAPYKLVSRELHPHDTVVNIGSLAIGGRGFAMVAGPCAVESYDQMRNTAEAVKAAGAKALRAGAYKPRTSPYGFRGHGPEGLKILRRVGDELDLPVITEVMDSADVDIVADHADALQIGARNMQNFTLLRAVGKARRPVLLKRGISAKIEEWLLAAEYLLAEGNDQVVLCERGIRTFETATRNTLDLNAVPYVKQKTHLPIMVDPSHGTGIRNLVPPMALAAAACGADGLLVEVHEDPAVALSDGAQSLYPDQFKALMDLLGPVVRAVGEDDLTQRLAEGQALALQRGLPSSPDPLALYAALTDHGRRRDTFLLERSVGPSLLMDQAAVRVECRGPRVTLFALSKDGGQVLATIARQLAARVEAESEDQLELLFPPVTGDDAEARLLAPSPFDVLRVLTGFTSASKEEPFTIAALGIVAYDHSDLFEALPANAEDPLGFPDYIFWLAESLILFEPGSRPQLVCTAFGSDDDAIAERAYYSAAARLAALVERCANVPVLPIPPTPSRNFPAPEVDLDDAAYGAVVSRLREQIIAGEVYQVVPSRTFRAPCPDPLGSYAAQRQLDPSPYQFFVAGPDHVVFGASPETSVRVIAGADSPVVEVKPIAGTRPRGANDDEDDRFEAEMRLDPKESAEHMMLVDLARNDVARVSASGTRRVAKLMTVERYARVMHLVSSITGRLRPGLDMLHALQACLNVGTLTGAPKIRATQLLRETEVTKRGPYGGAVGWLNGEGLMDTGVIIRSAVVKDGTAFVRAGAGVVYDSDPQREADETRRKASALLSVLAATGGAR